MLQYIVKGQTVLLDSKRQKRCEVPQLFHSIISCQLLVSVSQ